MSCLFIFAVIFLSMPMSMTMSVTIISFLFVMIYKYSIVIVTNSFLFKKLFGLNVFRIAFIFLLKFSPSFNFFGYPSLAGIGIFLVIIICMSFIWFHDENLLAYTIVILTFKIMPVCNHIHLISIIVL